MRLIARLDIKNNYVIKGINYEGLRKIGNPNEISKQYYDDGADEIILIDSVASLYDRSNIFKIINETVFFGGSPLKKRARFSSPPVANYLISTLCERITISSFNSIPIPGSSDTSKKPFLGCGSCKHSSRFHFLIA